MRAYERLLRSYAKANKLRRNCVGMDKVNNALSALIQKDADKELTPEILVAVAGVAGNIMMENISLEIMSRFPGLTASAAEKSKKRHGEQRLNVASQWLVSTYKRPWYHFWRWEEPTNSLTAEEAKDKIQQLLDRYFPQE